MKRRTKLIAGSVITFVGAVVFYFSLPDPLFEDPYSTVLEDRRGELLSASIATDGQWRFPEGGTVPDKFKEAIILYEDHRFEQHIGVDPLSLVRAFRQNIREGHIVSGGSTISMQVIRLSRKGQQRTFLEKIIEVVLAFRLELRYSKQEILGLYAAHAPFGGNVVGLESACWRYFGRSPQEINWSEAALLAILPNNPSLLHPGRNRALLKAKRDRFIDRLEQEGKMDELSASLAKQELLPERPQPIPHFAHHLLARMVNDGYSQRKITSTVDAALQRRVEQVVNDHARRLSANKIFNAAALVMDVRTGKVLAYVGNANVGAAYQEDVDVVMAPRSTGSILKPFLFAGLLEDGTITQKTLLQDIPTSIQGFAPKNFSHQFDGAVPADKALIRSLNVPFVHALRRYRYEKFYDLLKRVGITTLNENPDHYGLALILGGAEGTLWEITGAYASMARVLVNYGESPGRNKYSKEDIHSPQYINSSQKVVRSLEEASVFSAASIWLTFDVLKEVYRPGEETGWRQFESAKKIAWKTGTSIGFRDAWAVGVNPDYAVGVWAGNADGEGRPGLVGTEAAAPILFDLFSMLPGRSWFSKPTAEMQEVPLCSKSGQRASPLCLEVDTVWIARPGLASAMCGYHRQVHLSLDGKYRVHSECAPMGKMKTESWFVLPPVQEFYYRSRNITYRSLPPFGKGCADPSVASSMDLIYPRPNAMIYIPRELDGHLGNTVFEAAHRTPSALVYWHLDGNFIGTTQKSHHFALAPAEGKHTITLVDEYGESLERSFNVLSRQ